MWNLKPDEYGYVLYQRYIDADKATGIGCPILNPRCKFNGDSYKLNVNGTTYERRMNEATGSFFDAESKILYLFSGFGFVKSTFEGEASK
jgi:hypothetical protein